MLRVTVTSTETRNQSGKSKASGRDYSLDFQTVYVHTVDRTGTPNPYPEKVEIILEKDKNGVPVVYKPGDYTFAHNSIYVNRDNNLAISPRLVEIKPKTS